MTSLAELLCVIDDFCLEFSLLYQVWKNWDSSKYVDAGNKKSHPVKPKLKNGIPSR